MLESVWQKRLHLLVVFYSLRIFRYREGKKNNLKIMSIRYSAFIIRFSLNEMLSSHIPFGMLHSLPLVLHPDSTFHYIKSGTKVNHKR